MARPAPGDPDAVVVGGGHNGLVAANRLADARWSVVLLEATDTLGGAVRTAELAAPGFHSDVFSAFYPLAMASPVIRSLDLEAHGLEWCRAPDVLAHVLPDGRCAVLGHDPERTAESVARFSAGDAAAWRRLSEQFGHAAEPLFATMFHPLPPVAPGLRLARALGLRDTLHLTRLGVLPARRFGEEQFGGEGARLLIAGNAAHADIPVDSAGSAAFGWLMAMTGQLHGFPVPRGGAARLIDALVARLRSRGGTVRTGAAVETITMSGGRADGVVLASGERIPAGRAVLADVNAVTLYRDLIGHDRLPVGFVRELARFQWDPATVKVDWALRAPVPWRDDAVRGAGTVHLGVDMDGMIAYQADLARGRLPERPFVLLGQLTTADPSRSPAGTEAVWAYTHVPREHRMTEADVATVVQRMEAAIEAQAPGFADLVLGRHVLGPRGMQANNPNLVDGAINGGTAQLHQEAIFRPTIGLGGAVTPVDRLFLAGSSAHPGGGVHGGPGSNAAVAALHRAGMTGRARRRVVEAVFARLYR